MEGLGRDVVTIVSVVPFDIEEMKPGLVPSVFRIAAVKNYENEFSLCHIGYDEVNKKYQDVFHYWYIDETRGTVVVPDRTIVVAESIIEDYCRAQIAQTPEARPGMFIANGLVSRTEVPQKWGKELEKARARQKRWFEALVQMADVSWSRDKRHDLILSTMRFAAQQLGLEREWLFNTGAALKCPACRNGVDSEAILCGTCGYILKKDKFDASMFVGRTVNK